MTAAVPTGLPPQPSPDPGETVPVRVVSAASGRKLATLSGYLGYMKWLIAHTPLIVMLARVQLRLTVTRSKLHYFWWVLDPVLETALYAMLFTILRASPAADGTSVVAVLLVAMIPWRPTVGCWASVGSIWVLNKELIEQVRFPHLALLFVKFLTEFSLYLIAVVVLLALCLIVGVRPTWTWTLLPFWIAVHALVVMAVMPVFAIVTAFSDDLMKFVPYVLRLVFFASPVLYEASFFPDRLRPWLYLNPLTMLLETYRGILLRGVWPDPAGVALYIVSMLALLGITTYTFVRLSSAMARSVSRIY